MVAAGSPGADRPAVPLRLARLRGPLLVAGDLIALILAVTVPRLSFSGSGLHVDPDGLAASLGLLPVWIVLLALHGVYRRAGSRITQAIADDAGALLQVAVLVGVASALMGRQPEPAIVAGIVFGLMAFTLLVGARWLLSLLAGRVAVLRERVVVVGAGLVGALVHEKLERSRAGVVLVGFVDAEPRPSAHSGRLLGDAGDLRRIVGELAVDRVIVAFSRDSTSRLLDVLASLRGMRVQIDIVPRLFEALGPSGDFYLVDGLPVVGVRPAVYSRPALVLKRAIDIAVSGSSLVLLAPMMACFALLVRLDSPGPILYRHRRIGMGGRPFDVLKFRTMYAEFCRGDAYGGEQADQAFERLVADTSLSEDFQRAYKFQEDPRVTRFGAFLRRTSLDELPQLVNVLRGEMSLVGPRPVTEEELERYGTHTPELLRVPPGVTGYWQVNGRSDVSYDERVRLDMAYITSWSIRLDLRIMVATLRALRGHDGR